MNSARRQGQTERNQVARRIGQGKAMRPMSRSTRSRMMRAALSASMKNGIGHVLRSVMRERMKPGQITFMRMPSRARGLRKESAQDFIAAFVAA